ncbi:MAG: hypothetical protein KatS3mg118_1282 [Paracoccaceae bacterium]|nr:MAG: hypothetical protein KatS3mg118_1282 [Paracoccaceae bacterium]
MIVALIFLGQVLELRARERTGDAIKALLDLAPKMARRVLPDGTEYEAPVRRTWSRATGCGCARARRSRSTAVVVEGHSAVDESMITGEPMPVEKGPGDRSSAAPSTATAA